MSWVTFGKPLGILEDGDDRQKFLETSKRGLDYFAPVLSPLVRGAIV